jgi:hypothetical protein
MQVFLKFRSMLSQRFLRSLIVLDPANACALLKTDGIGLHGSLTVLDNHRNIFSNQSPWLCILCNVFSETFWRKVRIPVPEIRNQKGDWQFSAIKKVTWSVKYLQYTAVIGVGRFNNLHLVVGDLLRQNP